MKFSAQEEYGLRCLVAVARATNGASVTIPEIARSERLSEPHVAKLLMILRREGFVNSARGHTGGYSLSRGADQIVIGDVLECLGGRLYENDYCEKHGGLAAECVHQSECNIRGLWNDIQGAVDSVVQRITVRDLMEHGSKPTSRVTLRAAPRALKPAATPTKR